MQPGTSSNSENPTRPSLGNNNKGKGSQSNQYEALVNFEVENQEMQIQVSIETNIEEGEVVTERDPLDPHSPNPLPPPPKEFSN
jgi:hypothetical protein